MSKDCIIPLEDLSQLVCSSCNKFLSIFPVYLMNDNSGVICGRCTPFNKDNLIRDDAYEAIAEFLQFPCCHEKNGCQKQKTPQELQKHETECLFRKFECPTKVYTRCGWQGARADLLEHFEKDHPNLLLRTFECEWNFDTSDKENLLLTSENEFFIFKKEFDGRKQNFSCVIQHFAAQASSTSYNYIIKFLSNNKNFWFKLPEKSTENEESLTVNGDYIKEKLSNPTSVLIQIEIIKLDKKDDELKKPVDIEKSSDLNWEVLNELECPVCYDIMYPPIYQCTGGHSICKQCKLIVRDCPLCRKQIQNTRNYALEKFTLFLTYPCKYYKSGCIYVSKSSEMRKHEEKCSFGPYDCLLKEVVNCQIQINKSKMIDHIKNNHNSFILKSNIIKVPFNSEEALERFYLIQFYGLAFRMRYKYENRKFYWTVQLAGPPEECSKFNFDIDIIDNSKSKLRCYLMGVCAPIQEEIDFQDPRKYIMLTYEQLQPLITSTLDYNIHVVKN